MAGSLAPRYHSPQRKECPMIKRIPDLPDHVIGLTATGTVTANDYESVVIPAVEAQFARREKVRLLYRLDEGFSGFEAGAMWDDAKVGLKHLSGWERIALVTDVGWIRDAARVFAVVIPGHFRVFGNPEYSEAVRWISE